MKNMGTARRAAITTQSHNLLQDFQNF